MPQRNRRIVAKQLCLAGKGGVARGQSPFLRNGIRPRATEVGSLCNAKGSDPEAGYNVGSINAPPCATRS